MVAETYLEHAALVALLSARPEKLSWQSLTDQVLEQGSALAVWNSFTEPALVPDPEQQAALDDALEQVRAWANVGQRFLSVLDDDYPAQLRDIHQVPPFLFAAGELRRDDIAVSVVGSRQVSERGLEIAGAIARSLVADGLTVVSGLAEGVDAAAHTSALAVGGRTVAIIGTGINQQYPAKNRNLQTEIARHGLVLSQFWPDAPPTKKTFPMRNATMSGYGLASVIVEAGEHSGARIQARLAVEHGRPVILTDAVVRATEWGKALMSRPDVHQASSVREVMDIVRRIRERPEGVSRLVQRLAAVGR